MLMPRCLRTPAPSSEPPSPSPPPVYLVACAVERALSPQRMACLHVAQWSVLCLFNLNAWHACVFSDSHRKAAHHTVGFAEAPSDAPARDQVGPHPEVTAASPPPAPVREAKRRASIEYLAIQVGGGFSEPSQLAVHCRDRARQVTSIWGSVQGHTGTTR